MNVLWFSFNLFSVLVTFLVYSLSTSFCYSHNDERVTSFEFIDSSDTYASHKTNQEVELDDDESVHSLFHNKELSALKRKSASQEVEDNLLAEIYAPNRTYVSIHDDKVAPFNFSYYTLSASGTFRLILISLTGDADIYVSSRQKEVNYTNYEMSSCTCGIDELVIDSRIKRPINIGIYGHSQYRTSQYRLLVELLDTPTVMDYSGDSYYSDRTSSDEHRGTKGEQRVEEPREHVIWSIFLWLLNFLVEVMA